MLPLFARRKLAPIASKIDESNEFPRSIWPMLGELGVLGMTVEQSFGGVDLGYLAHTVVMEKSAELLPQLDCLTVPIRICV